MHHSAAISLKEPANPISEGKKVSKLTGIAPSTYLFKDEAAAVQISVDDADFVEVFHTELDSPISGHADFYFQIMAPEVPPPSRVRYQPYERCV